MDLYNSRSKLWMAGAEGGSGGGQAGPDGRPARGWVQAHMGFRTQFPGLGYFFLWVCVYVCVCIAIHSGTKQLSLSLQLLYSYVPPPLLLFLPFWRTRCAVWLLCDSFEAKGIP